MKPCCKKTLKEFVDDVEKLDVSFPIMIDYEDLFKLKKKWRIE